jgi:hypothetical protein
MRWKTILSALAVLVVLSAGTAIAAPRNYAHVSIAPETVIMGGVEHVTGSVSSPGGISGLSVSIDGKQYRPRMIIGKIGEKNLNGKWIVRMPHAKWRHGTARVRAIAVPRHYGHKGLKHGKAYRHVSCVAW